MSKIEKGSGNVYADLGMPDAEEMLVKAQLSTKIAEIIKLRKMTQTQAAQVLGMPQPKLSNMLRGRFRGILVKPSSKARKIGRVSVSFA
mgnify:CR=1 FL=1